MIKRLKANKILYPLLFLQIVILTFLLSLITKDQRLENSLDVNASKVVSSCKIDSYEDCYQKKFSSITHMKGIEYTKSLLSRVQDLDLRTRACHTIAHSIAQAEVDNFPSKWKDLLKKEDTQICSGGFFHGILEGHKRYDSAFDLTGSEIVELCSNKNNAYTTGSCLHVMGHLLLVESDANIREATKVCDQIKLSSSYECDSGIFMEYMTGVNLKAHGIGEVVKWDQDVIKKLENVCSEYSGDAAKGCWGQLGYMYAGVNGDSPKIAYNLCQKAENYDNVSYCYKHSLSKIAITADQPKVNVLCSPYSSDLKEFKGCIFTVLNVMKNASPKFSDKAYKFCDSLQEPFIKECNTYAKTNF